MGERRHVVLRELTLDDVGTRYLGWLQDPAVNRHLESRFSEQSLETLEEFVRENSGRDDALLLAIVEQPGGNHVGNLKIGPLHPHHRTADVGLLIGEADARGKGYGTEAIRLATRLGFERLGARKLTASLYADNPASAAAFRRAGWRYEGARPAQFMNADGEPQDQILFGIVNPES